MEQRIQVSHLYKSIKGQPILEDISFAAEQGKITAFLGPNGAGKSTTLRILLGLDRPSAGEVRIGGKSYVDFAQPMLVLGASFDGVGAPYERKVKEHLHILATSNGLPKSRIAEVLALCNMRHKADSLVGSLSLGEGQHMGIAAALLGDPQYLVMDEPTNGLDPEGIRWFRQFIRQQADRGKTVLLSSHILAEVEAVCDEVVVIQKGRILAKGPLDAVMQGRSSLEELFFDLTKGEKAHA